MHLLPSLRHGTSRQFGLGRICFYSRLPTNRYLWKSALKAPLIQAPRQLLSIRFRSQPGYGRTRSWTDALNRIPPRLLVIGIIGINAAVYFMWMSANQQAREGDLTLSRWMNDNFILRRENLAQGRYHTLLTCCFSHESTSHLLFNCLTFFFFGPPTISVLGSAAFLSLYLGGGLVSSLSSYAWRSYTNKPGGSHGASGAIYATLSFFACVAPKARIYLYGIIPVPAWALIPGVLLWDGWSAATERRTQTDHAGHIGGIAAGILYFLAL